MCYLIKRRMHLNARAYPGFIHGIEKMDSLHIFIFFAILTIAKASRIFYTDIGVTTLIESSPTYCKVHTNRHIIKYIVKFHTVIYCDDATLEQNRKSCEASQKAPRNGTFSYPGTLWCGPGTRARTYDDLGFHYKEDSCCREHDQCTKVLLSGTCLENLCNYGSPFTRSHCDCDNKLRKCLQDVKTEIANTIGAIFFNIAQLICFEENANCDGTNTNSVKNKTECPYKFMNAGRYSTTSTARVSTIGKKEHVLNIFLRKIGLL